MGWVARREAPAHLAKVQLPRSQTLAFLAAVESVTVRDQAPGAPDFELEIELESVDVTDAEVIRAAARWRNWGRVGGTVPRPIVAISELELTLNGARDNARELDAEREVARAMTAFERGRFVVVVAGRQIQRTDETMTLTPGPGHVRASHRSGSAALPEAPATDPSSEISANSARTVRPPT
jgi:hypothetical protein